MNLVISAIDGLDRGVSVQGEIDLATVDALEQAIASLPRGPGPIVIEGSRIDFMDSTGLRLLLGLAEASEETPAIVIRNPSSAVLRVFELSLPAGAPGLILESGSDGSPDSFERVESRAFEPSEEPEGKKGVRD
jgi:anti-sigma B factor antagonist